MELNHSTIYNHFKDSDIVKNTKGNSLKLLVIHYNVDNKSLPMKWNVRTRSSKSKDSRIINEDYCEIYLVEETKLLRMLSAIHVGSRQVGFSGLRYYEYLDSGEHRGCWLDTVVSLDISKIWNIEW